MGLAILIILLGLPVAEIVGFVVIGGEIGVLATLAWIFLAGFAGIAIMRLQSLATALQVRVAMARGELPARAILDGACVAVAGLLLLIPGFVSDVLAALLLIPPLRGLLFRILARRFAGRVDVVMRGGQAGPGARPPGGVVIEGEFEEVEPRPGEPRPGEPGAGDGSAPGPGKLPPAEGGRDGGPGGPR